MLKATTNRLQLFAAALLFSTGGAAIKASSLSSWQVAGFRSGIAAAVLYIGLPNARPSEALRWTWRIWLIGLAYAAALILFVAANKLTTSANAIFLQSTAPLYLLLLGPLVLREPIRRVDVAVIFTVAAGAILLLLGSKVTGVTSPDPGRGNLLGLAGGVAWALTLTGLRWAGKQHGQSDPAAATVIAGNILAFAICLPMATPVNNPSLANLAVVLYLGVFQIALAYIFLTRSMREVQGLEAATLLLIEPVLNPIWTWIVHGERPGIPALWGGLLIIGAAFAGTAWRLRQQVYL